MSSSNNFVPELSTTAPASESAQVHGNQSSGRRTGRGGRAGRGRGGLNAELVPGASDEQRERRRDGQKRTRRGGNVDRGRGLSGRSPWEQRQGYHQSDIREPDVAPGVDGDQPQIAIRRASTAETEAEVCFICASNVVHQSVAPCNHRTCHICALRLRALYKTKACAHCRTNADYVIFTDDGEKQYQDFSLGDFTSSDINLGIRYERPEIFEDTILLLRYNCPDPDCDVACLGWPDLHRHVKSIHHKVMCDLCTRNKKVFTHEHELFTQSDLKKHEKFGDDDPGAIDQSGFKGHPECGFCRIRFYGDDELYTHCRDKHERCHICDRQNQGKQQYYVNYDSLEEHFRQAHFLCLDKDCLEKKFVVFDTEMDLKAHQLETHPLGLSKDARRDARRVDMSTFNFRAPHEQQRGLRREGRGRGRGQDPNTEPIPQSSAQPMRRDELAYHRQMAIQSAQSVSTRTFGGQLSSAEAPRGRPSPSVVENASNETQHAMPGTNAITTRPSLGDTNGASREAGSAGARVPMTPKEQARALQHRAVTDRVATLVNNDPHKLEEFKSKVSSFRKSEISSTELVDSFFTMFDTSSAELGKLVKELAELYDSVTKRESLLKAWSDWRAINEDYPSLPGPSGIPAGTGINALAKGGSRVLKLKSSTAQSSRSAMGVQGSWGSATSSSTFPPLPRGQNSGAPWVAASSARRISPQPSRAPLQTHTARKVLGGVADEFPALPAAARPTTTLFRPGAGGGGAVLRDGWGRAGTAGNAWGGSGQAGSSVASEATSSEDPKANGQTKKKGKQNKKQVLYHFG